MNKTTYVYRVYRGGKHQYYHHHNMGSWEARSEGVKARDILTLDLNLATHFISVMDGPPYLHKALDKGRWVKVITTYQIVEL